MIKSISDFSVPQALFASFGVVTTLSILMGVWTESPFYAAVPALFLFSFLVVADFRWLYYLLMLSLPISMEYTFPNGFGTDLPTEPIIVGLTFIYILIALSSPKSILTQKQLKNPVLIALSLHFAWIFFTMFFSSNFTVSLKFFLAKTWYILTFLLMSLYLLRNEKDILKIFWCIFGVTIPIVALIFYRHSQMNFGFREINTACVPFFRNHVTYAAFLTILLPWAIMMLSIQKRFNSLWWFIGGGIVIIFMGVTYSYTRAAYLSLVIAFAAYWGIRFRLMRLGLIVAIFGIAWIINYLVAENKFMDYAPTERTIAHEAFEDIVNATSKLEDVSTMERYYRWIAGARMTTDKWAVGFGPGNFYNFYKPYALSRFKTYVSDNPEKSGIHNYFLMTTVEQGFLGLFFFILLSFTILIYGEKVYHQTTDILRRALVMSALLILVVIYSFLLINDMIETDKVGSFFFMCIAFLIKIDEWNNSSAEGLQKSL